MFTFHLTFWMEKLSGETDVTICLDVNQWFFFIFFCFRWFFLLLLLCQRFSNLHTYTNTHTRCLHKNGMLQNHYNIQYWSSYVSVCIWTSSCLFIYIFVFFFLFVLWLCAPFCESMNSYFSNVAAIASRFACKKLFAFFAISFCICSFWLFIFLFWFSVAFRHTYKHEKCWWLMSKKNVHMKLS